MRAILESDLNVCILNKEYIVFWQEFRGKTRTNRSFKQYTYARDKLYRDVYHKICGDLVKFVQLQRDCAILNE